MGLRDACTVKGLDGKPLIPYNTLVATHPRTMELGHAVALLCKAIRSDFERRSPQFADKFETEVVAGRKYLKVVIAPFGQKSVHAFVDKATGQVFKAASWNAPAKGARYNLLDEKSRELCLSRADYSGRYLYLR